MIIKLLLVLLCFNNQLTKDKKSHQQSINKINKIEENIKVEENIKISKTTYKEMPIGTLIIEKISLNNPIYSKTSSLNNIEQNVTIIKDSTNLEDNNSLIILAAHSGTGKIAYFNNLNKLNINDEIKLTMYKKEHIFIVTNIFEQDKNGYINIAKNNKSQLILTTCSIVDKNKQLIIESTKKEL